MSWKEHTQSNAKIMKNSRINETKASYFFILLHITFYNLNPLFGLFSSFEVLLTLSFSLSS